MFFNLLNHIIFADSVNAHISGLDIDCDNRNNAHGNPGLAQRAKHGAIGRRCTAGQIEHGSPSAVSGNRRIAQEPHEPHKDWREMPRPA
jgi:hypothetical protein